MTFDAIVEFFHARTSSKYEEKGKDFRNVLRKMMKNNIYSIFYSYQMEAVLETHRYLQMEDRSKSNVKGGQRLEFDPLLIIAPTGSGKSGIIVMLPYVLQSRKVLILTPSVLISKQLERAFGINKKEESFFQVTGFSKAGGKAGLDNILETGIVLKHPHEIGNRLPNLVIVNAQKFGGRSRLSLQYNDEKMVDDVEEFFGQFDTLIVDEAHHYPAKTWVTIVEQFQKPAEGLQKQIIFITATPYRSVGGKHKPILKNQHQRITYQIRSRDVEGKTVRRLNFVEKTKVSNLAKDIKALLKQNAKREPRIPKHQAIVLVSRQDEADSIAVQLNDAMKSTKFAVSIVGNCKKEEIQKRMEDFKKGRYEVAVN
ncbi:unnamed protein product [Orchesella dallaii]|uniref:Helicase ATP-binding domain-containing protein n=1 Tax=Orchesella dallaii TaxID=48710 RepID=A0ABP1RIT5_9HEXA